MNCLNLDSITSAAADAVINARDFCGNEREAALETFLDHGVKPTENDIFNAIQNANLQWDRFRRAARLAASH